MIANYLGLIARKCGMSYVVRGAEVVPVTIVYMDDLYIVDVKTIEKNGYNALTLGSYPVKESKTNKPQKTNFESMSVPCLKILKEFRLPTGVDMSSFALGQKMEIDFQKLIGCLIDVQSVGKGKGFAGVVKKYGFAGQLASHGESLSERSLGSTGNRTDPGKVFKNKKMPSRMGGKIVTTQNMEIIKVDAEKSLIFIKGTIPGFQSQELFITNAIKKVIILPSSTEVMFNFVKALLLKK